MKTKTWLLLLGALLLISAALCVVLFLPGKPAQQIQVLSNGTVLHTLPLTEDRTVTVESPWGTNVITICNGAVAVTEADCPDGICKARGFCSSGAQIVCLPHRLVIRFLADQETDGLAG